MRCRRLPVLGLALLGAFATQPSLAEPREMVAAANPRAVDAGLDVLRRGGSAVDAAVVVQMVLGVVEPQASGLGGGGFLLHYDAATRTIDVYDGRETAPAAAGPGMFLGRDGVALPMREAIASGLSVGVPGVLPLLELAHKEHGKLAWGGLFEPAIDLARDGYAAAPRLAAWLAIVKSFAGEAAAHAVYFRADGQPKQPGERIVNHALARTMELVARDGSLPLRKGGLADEMVARVRSHRHPGTLSLADLENYKPIKREALCGPYRVWLVCGMPPPSSGGLAVLQILALLEPFRLSQDAPNDLRSLHLIAEASRLAFADRARYVADPAFVPVPVTKLLAPGYIAQRRKLISPDGSLGRLGPVAAGYVEHGTSHMTIVDRDGNAVAFTTTIEAAFGAQMMVGGFLLNNELTDFSPYPEVDGKPVANRVEGGKRPRSSMSPTFVLDGDRRLVLAVGSAGGQRIIGDTVQALIGMLDWNLSAQSAIDLPRVLNMNGRTELEDRGSLPAQADALRGLGHQVQVGRHDGGLTAIRRVSSPEGDGWQGGADPRRDGAARGE